MATFAVADAAFGCVPSCTQVVGVDIPGRCLVLGGTDIIDGSPILDLKPYVPFCDSVPQARTPPWVQVRVVSHRLGICTPYWIQG